MDAPARGADRTLAVLRRLARYPRGVTLDDLASDVGVPKSSLHRSLQALRYAGLVEQLSRGVYTLGLDFVRLAFEFYEAMDRPELLHPVLSELASTYGETAHYAELVGGEVVYLAKVAPLGQGVQMTSTVGGRNPAHCTGIGKALLAQQLPDVAAVRRWVASYGPLQPRTANTLTEPEALADDFDRIRGLGYAIDAEESELGVNCLAVPIFLGSRVEPAGAISIAALAQRRSTADLEALADRMFEIIGGHLGAGALHVPESSAAGRGRSSQPVTSARTHAQTGRAGG